MYLNEILEDKTEGSKLLTYTGLHTYTGLCGGLRHLKIRDKVVYYEETK
jgi:hypothetical protein